MYGLLSSWNCSCSWWSFGCILGSDSHLHHSPTHSSVTLFTLISCDKKILLSHIQINYPCIRTNLPPKIAISANCNEGNFVLKEIKFPPPFPKCLKVLKINDHDLVLQGLFGSLELFFVLKIKYYWELLRIIWRKEGDLRYGSI